MSIPIIGGLLDSLGIGKLVTKLGDRAIDKAFGESPEQSAARRKQEMEQAVAEAQDDTARFKALYDFIIQYEGTAAQMPKPIQYIRAIPRPLAFMYSIFMVYFCEFAGKAIKLNSLAGVVTLLVIGSFFGTKLIRDYRGLPG